MWSDKLKKLKQTLGIKDDTPVLEAGVEKHFKKKEVVPPDKDDIELEEMEEIVPTNEEKSEMEEEMDAGYLAHSAEVVGYENRAAQWDIYRAICQYPEEGASILDFGCGRGDFIPFYISEFDVEPLYTGIDMNENLINAGNELYPDSNLMAMDWFKLSDEIKADWCINIGSNNLRYDADVVKTDDIYLQDTITTMYNHADKGVVILLASNISNIDDGLINHDPGGIFNWAQGKFSNVALDHTISNDVFCLIIYK